MINFMDSMDYPVFTVTEGKLLPNVVIPSEVRGNYESIVERMFGMGGSKSSRLCSWG